MKINSNEIYQKQQLLHKIDDLPSYYIFTVCTMLSLGHLLKLKKSTDFNVTIEPFTKPRMRLTVLHTVIKATSRVNDEIV